MLAKFRLNAVKQIYNNNGARPVNMGYVEMFHYAFEM